MERTDPAVQEPGREHSRSHLDDPGRGVPGRAVDWAAHDIDDADRAAIGQLVARAEAGDAAAETELVRAFAGPLTFGTAGLRAPLGPGESSMNRAVVTRATAGLVAYLQGLGIADPVVAIGHDARHGSAAFAADAAAVVTAAGGLALLVPGAQPTPVLAFAVRRHCADAGVMVTASHNPAVDNGYKVYLGGRAIDTRRDPGGVGAQIVPPADVQIAAAIAAVPPADRIPRRLGGEILHGIREDYAQVAAATRAAHTAWKPVPDELALPANASSDLRVLLTPMHGVGGALARDVLNRAGFPHVRLVAAQAEPDPDFPTVAFPNPELPGALDRAIADAAHAPTDLIVALDPDADRCTAAVPDLARPTGWRQLTGDELGALLGDAIAARHAGHRDATLASSIVSSTLLARIAAHHGVAHATTLTGFKWISRVPGLVFGYEEAIGFCVDPESVRDKDGITAAVALADLADRLRCTGRTLADAVDELHRRHGVHLTAQVAVRTDDAAAMLVRLLTKPPRDLAGIPVAEPVDLSRGHAGLPPTPGLLLQAGEACRLIIRPSGTEPLLKCYLQVVEPVGESLVVARERAEGRMAALRAEAEGLVALTP